MSNDDRDSNNPFAPPRGPRSDDDSDEYRFDYRPEDFDYDPEDILDDEEEPEAGGAWRDGSPTREAAPAAGPRDDRDTPPEPDFFEDPAFDEFDREGDEGDDPVRDDIDDDDGDDDYPGDEEPDWDDEDEDDEDERQGLRASWPLGMIAIAVVALILLAVGGFGVMQERSALEEQVRDLQARLALAVAPEEVTAEREARRELLQRYEALEREAENLRLENRQLADTASGLEQQLEAQRQTTRPETASAKPEPKPESKPAPAAPPATAVGGKWFVNFGSYSQRALAASWAERLEPAAGEVVVSPAPDSKLYRVRVIALPDKATAQAVATALQDQYDLPRLWVGKE